MNRASTRLFAVLAACVLSGCALSPKPMPVEEHLARAQADRQGLYDGQIPLPDKIDLSTALARALKYNFDHRMALMETALQDKQLSTATLAMLPKLAAGAGYRARSNELASSSISYETRNQSLEPSVSQDLGRYTLDLSLTWNVLDFGLSYLQAKQQADRVLTAVERRRRIVNNIVKEVHSAWWRAASAERLLPLIDPTLADAEAALARLEQVEAKGKMPPVMVLEQQKSLLQIIASLRKLKTELALAKTQLAALMNAPFGRTIAVALPTEADEAAPALKTELAKLEELGLTLRPDLREEAYQERIDRQTIYKEYVKMIPGASVFGSFNADSNSYLINQTWFEFGGQLAITLINLVQGPFNIAAAEKQVEVDQSRRKAMTIAAVAQINIAKQQYDRALEARRDAVKAQRIEERIAKAVGGGAAQGAKSELDDIRTKTQAIAARLDADRSLAEVHTALANVYFSMGLDLYEGDVNAVEPGELAKALGKTLDDWRNERFPEAPKPITANADDKHAAVAEAPRDIEKSAATGVSAGAEPLARRPRNKAGVTTPCTTKQSRGPF